MSEVVQKTGQRLILNDETVIEDGRCGYADGILWCFFAGYTFPQVAELFLNPDKTRHIVFMYGEMQDEYNGFTNCVNIGVDSDGQFSVALKRGANDAP